MVGHNGIGTLHGSRRVRADAVGLDARRADGIPSAAIRSGLDRPVVRDSRAHAPLLRSVAGSPGGVEARRPSNSRHGARAEELGSGCRAIGRGSTARLPAGKRRGADTRTSAGESALAAAAAADQIAAATLLITRGARLENRTRVTFETPLTEAAKMNHLAMVRLLLDHGAEIEANDVTGRAALDWAHENSNTDMERLIRSHSAR
jgi:ankyrin repeat protein